MGHAQLFNRKKKIRHMHAYMLVYVQILGNSYETLSNVLPKNIFISFVTQSITVSGESVIQGFPSIHFS